MNDEKYTLILGECLENMRVLPDNSVDMILCDLPYGTTACKWDTVIPFEPLWAAYRRIAKKNAAIVLTASQPFTSALVMSNPRMFRYEWIWKKPYGSGHLNAKKQPMRNHENILLFSKNPTKYNPQITFGAKPYKSTPTINGTISNTYGKQIAAHSENKDGSRYPTSIQEFQSVDNRHGKLHPTQKPVALMEYLIRTYTNEGELVLDNTMGSGTTGVACANTNRRFIGIEQDEVYFNIARARIQEAYSQRLI